ncbi:MAG TPA: 4Fe-4S binding protein, partial [Hyphomicrobiaceae bacterium]|nr:4Fe-4S binding protein [Hyphomicrobiaceae bacterium]
MQVDGAALAKSLGRPPGLKVHSHLCRTQITQFEEAIASGGPLLVACTQEAPLFRELAEERGQNDIEFVNIREQAGWCAKPASALPKMAALIAAAAHQPKPTGVMTITSEGQCLVYGKGQTALDAATQLSGRLSVTVVLSDAADAMPPTTTKVPLHIGRISKASGTLGRFSVSIDGFAPNLASSRGGLKFEAPRNGFSTTCDLLLDLSGGPALFSDAAGREGYVKCDPANPVALAKAIFEISDLVGEFEKPLYVGYDAYICAHSRSTKIGCRNCLDNCPTGAITPDGDKVAIDPAICGGCGNCSAVCPTGAVSYAYPGREDLIQRIQILAKTYTAAGGRSPVLLLHDDDHGAGAIAMMARYGRGLPPNVVPASLYSVFQVGHEAMAAALACGFEQIVVLVPPDKPHDFPAIDSQIALINAFLEALGHGGSRVKSLNERDPDAIEAALHDLPQVSSMTARLIAPAGGKRDIARSALTALNEAAPEPREMIALPAGAPYGRISVDADNCTLCLACVGACPAGALSDDNDRPRLSFNEQACVQCGLCVATCPERVIKLEPRYNFTSAVLEPVMIKEEE